MRQGETWFGPTPFILSTDPQVAQDILTSPHCINKSPELSIFFNEVLGNGLLTSNAFETTYTTIGCTLMLLAMFPQFQEKVFEELKEIFPNTGDFDVTHEDLQKMDYLQRVLSETMRLMPPVPIIVRLTAQDVRLSNDIIVPKFTNVAISTFHMHRSKDIWGPDANTFNPDHFLPHNIQDKHSYAYIPFAKGPRNCIGWRYALMMSKLTLAKLLRNYKFHTDFPFENLKPIHSVTLKFNEVPLLKLERRY
ncbi:probable cytochrome P450 313a4 [Drosophila tropicalis]|uniref:probable cytochrome P450 313a4 n=1 Tax=Drosophila tropicalis TaxID=46794 RepID=UPI0035ABE349